MLTNVGCNEIRSTVRFHLQERKETVTITFHIDCIKIKPRHMDAMKAWMFSRYN